MTSDWVDRYWQLAAGSGVWAVFGVLTLPFVAATVDVRLTTPLAGPGYVLFVGLTIVGERIVPQYKLVVYWVPFLVSCYLLSVVVAGIVRAMRD